jgi:hypothetical protein
MNKRTYVGLDVHARSAKGCAIDRETGETLRQSLAANDAGIADRVARLPARSWWSMKQVPRGSDWPGYWPRQGSSAWSRRRPGSSDPPGTG